MEHTLKLLIIGQTGGTNVGESFLKAAISLKIEPVFINFRLAYSKSQLINQIYWHLLHKRHPKIKKFSQHVLQTCYEIRPQVILSTGIAPITKRVLENIGQMGVVCCSFLTDDPWSSTHYARWFFTALPFYDVIFTPRRANMADLKKIGCKNVVYLPFGFDPDLFYPEEAVNAEEKSQFSSDILFAGGADQDRVNYISALINAGFRVGLYGSYWERYPQTRNFTKGQADVRTLRLATGNTKIALCLVRRANRDGNSMRTFEVPAVGACMLAEETQEHREIFGEEGQAVVYFRTIEEMLKKTTWLLAHEQERQKLAQNVHWLICQGGHTYKDRLQTILKTDIITQSQ